MASQLGFTYADYQGQKATVAFQGIDLTAANFDGQVASANTLRSAIEGVMIDPAIVKMALGNVLADDASARSTSVLNRREQKWLVRMSDNVTGEILKREIPGPDLTLTDPNSRGKMLLSGAEGVALVAAIQTFFRNPETGNAVTVLEVLHVGRNI